jgi:heptosyltransferase-2
MISIPKIKKILVVQTAFIGDVILITPLLSAIKQLCPEALIDVMVIPQASNVLENNPSINSIIVFDKRSNKLKSFLNNLTLLKKNKYDVAITPHSSVTTALLLVLSRIKIRIGFRRYFAQKFLTHRVPHIKNKLKIEKNLHLLSVLTDKQFSVQTEMYPTIEMQHKADSILSEMKKKSFKIVAVAPGSNWFTKRWPLEYYKELVNELSEANYGIVFIGSSQERELCESIKPIKNAINMAGSLSLLESSALIDKCDLMVCNDSGAMHLANSMKTDVFVFFGPTVERIGYFPIGKNDKVFQIEMDCRPCSSHGTESCPLGHHNCMRKITSDEVLENIYRKFGPT